MSRHLLRAAGFISSVALVISACTSPPKEAAVPKPAGKPVDPATAGSIAGKVTFTGTPPASETIRMGSDPACSDAAGPNPQNDIALVSKDGALRNVFIYIKDGL